MTAVTAQVKARVEKKLKDGIKLAEAKYKITIPMPTVVYHKRGTTAGTANYRTWTIDLNPTLLMENVDEFIERTVPHELAHLITDKVYPESHQSAGLIRTRRGYKRAPREVHGPNWQSVCLVLGMTDITRCHQYDTTNSKVVKSNRRNIAWKCSRCNAELMLTPKKSARLDLDPNAVWHRGCRGAPLVRVQIAVGTPVDKRFTTDNVPPIQLKTTPIVPKAPEPLSGNKIDVCKTLYLKFSMLSRAEIIAKFVSQAGCTPAGAGTYYATCKKLYG